ncbi:MAG: hypothetical protein H6834_15200 [Planctomycetes bacterium]|nr:hypothetical protein [Planctomycetota bacterium]
MLALPRWRSGFLAVSFLGLLSLVSSSYAQTDDDVRKALVGDWLFRQPSVLEVRIELTSDGAFTHRQTNEDGTETTKGKWSYANGTLTARPRGEKTLKFRCRLVDDDTLELVDDEGEGLRLVRQKKTEPPVHAARHFRLYVDGTQKAFTVLVPEGWQTSGGVLPKAPMGQTLVEQHARRILFATYDPKTQAAVQVLPFEMFGSQPDSYVQVAPGAPLNGMRQFRMPLAPSQLVQQWMFPNYRQGVSNVRFANVTPMNTLAQRWYKAFVEPGLQPGIAANVRAEMVESFYDIESTKYKEVWISLVSYVQVATTTIWTADITVTARAPEERFAEFEPLLRSVIASFQVDPHWFAVAVAEYKWGAEQVRITQDQIRRIEAAIQKKRMEVQDSIRRIDREIVEGRARTNEIIQETEHQTLMGLEEYRDPSSGQRMVLELGYERNYTNGSEVIQTNDWQWEPPPGWRSLEVLGNTDK